MDEAHIRVLEKCQDSILSDLDYNIVCPNLILTGLLNWKLHHIINARPTNLLKVRALMAVIPRRGPMAFQKFLAALDGADYVWLVQEINRALYQVYTEELEEAF